MSGFWRLTLVLVVGIWMLGTLPPQLNCLWAACPDNGLYVDYDGVVVGIGDGSPAAKASIQPGDRVAAPLPRGLFQLPPPPLTINVVRSGASRTVTVLAQPVKMTDTDRAYFISIVAAYLVFLIVGSTILLLRPSPMTWAFYLYCVLRRFGDLGFYWPGSDWFFWANYLALVALGGASCALVTIFALRFPSNRLEGWRIPANRAAVALAIVLPLAWFCVFGRIVFLGLPSQWLFDRLVNFTSIVYLAAAAIFIATLVRSHGDERQRMRWILVFPVVLLLRVAAINIPYSLPDWFSGLLTALGVCVPLTVAYAVIRQRVFNIQFAISRALIYGAITTIIAGTFLLLDWFMGKEFAQTQLTLTAEIIVALALGSSLSMLHHGVDRFVDGTFFRARHEAEKRLARAAVALSRADSHQMVDRFLVHEPVQALDLTSGALFHRDRAEGRFVREIAAGWSAGDVGELAEDDPLVLHLLAEGTPIRLADVRWSTEDLPSIGNSVLATPVLLRDELLTIVLYGPHRNGADIDPDEVRSIVKLAESAGATYDHIEARMLRAEVESLKRELAGRLTASPKAL